MGGIRQNPNPWLADHVIFSCYRWLSWSATAALLFWQGSLPVYSWVLLATGLLNIPITLFAWRYAQAARRNPALMALDILYTTLTMYAAMLLSGGDGWGSPFVLYAYSSLVLPALLFGWRGGIMAGLSFVTMDRVALWAANRLPSDLVIEIGWVGLVLMMVGPPAFGGMLPGLVELLRRTVARRSRRSGRREPLPRERLEHEARSNSLRFSALDHDDEGRPEKLPVEAPLAVQATKIRATEQSVEDLRRVIFAPFPTADMDLPAALDLLALRLRQHTGVVTRLALLGRTRYVHPAHRGVLVRLTQEALLNVQQHAHAASTVLTLRYDAVSIVLLIQDDGVGLLDGTYERPGLHALRAMHYRLAELGGRLDVFETEGGGVTVRATMPLE